MGVDHDRTGSFSLQLLDAIVGDAVQIWDFMVCDRISIGRGPDNDITLTDQQISRLHVELIYQSGHWILRSHGRNGTWIDGALVTEYELADQSIFQLNSSGPKFQFLATDSRSSSSATVNELDPYQYDFLTINEKETAEEVDQIVESESFKMLEENARGSATSAKAETDKMNRKALAPILGLCKMPDQCRNKKSGVR